MFAECFCPVFPWHAQPLHDVHVTNHGILRLHPGSSSSYLLRKVDARNTASTLDTFAESHHHTTLLAPPQTTAATPPHTTFARNHIREMCRYAMRLRRSHAVCLMCNKRVVRGGQALRNIAKSQVKCLCLFSGAEPESAART